MRLLVENGKSGRGLGGLYAEKIANKVSSLRIPGTDLLAATSDWSYQQAQDLLNAPVFVVGGDGSINKAFQILFPIADAVGVNELFFVIVRAGSFNVEGTELLKRGYVTDLEEIRDEKIPLERTTVRTLGSVDYSGKGSEPHYFFTDVSYGITDLWALVMEYAREEGYDSVVSHALADGSVAVQNVLKSILGQPCFIAQYITDPNLFPRRGFSRKNPEDQYIGRFVTAAGSLGELGVKMGVAKALGRIAPFVPSQIMRADFRNIFELESIPGASMCVDGEVVFVTTERVLIRKTDKKVRLATLPKGWQW